MKKKLIIVSNDGERKYATYLQQLVSALDDEDGKQVGVKDGSVDATIWDEKRFNDNEYAISSSNKILFVGWNDTANMNTTNMSDSFSACGMHLAVSEIAHTCASRLTVLMPTIWMSLNNFARNTAKPSRMSST